MTSIDRDDPLLMLNRLSRLPAPAPDPARSRRILERCHRQLVRRRRRSLRWRGFSRRFLEPAAIGAFSLIYVTYLTAVVRNALRWRGLD